MPELSQPHNSKLTTSTPGVTPPPTASPTPTPTSTIPPTETPTPTPTSTEVATALCRFIEVETTPEGPDMSRYGVRYEDANGNLVQTTFNQSFGYDTGTSQIFGYCSTLAITQLWDSVTNTLVMAPAGVNFLADGDVCTLNNCVWSPPTQTPNPTDTPTPTPTAEISCVEYSYDDSGSFGDPDRIIIFTNCEGNADSFSFPPGGFGTFCAQQGSVSAQNTTTVTAEGDCTTGGVGPTSTPQATPVPTASPTAAVTCTEYSYDDSGSFGDPDRTIIYTDCSGSPSSFSFPAGGFGTFCAQTGSVGAQNTTTVTAEGPCSTGTNPSPTSTPQATPAPTATEAQNNFYISTARFAISDFCEPYLAGTLITSSASNISGLLGTIVYNSSGNPYPGNSSRYYFVSQQQNADSTTVLGPQYITIDFTGEVISVGLIDCSSPGGGGEFSEEIGPTPTPE